MGRVYVRLEDQGLWLYLDAIPGTPGEADSLLGGR